uniref:tetrahydrofolate synthase n=1 Tax=Gallus gallus TaxID=9031 RepID=A0A8V1AJ93_CHICK
MRGFLERSGLQVEDLDRLNIIHVTGTKGKGSACAFTERILRGYGLRTGFYSSPHLVQVRERIRINGQPLSKELFSKYFWLVYRRLRGTKDESQANMPAYFRFLTIMAFHVFLQEKVDLAVVEVGIGGAFDCTNIIRAPVVCGVSSLGIDHTSILGDTVEKIAWQKGGIFKPGVPAFTVPQPEQPLEVLRDRARECGCPLYLCPELDAFEAGTQVLELGLAGSHQRSNAALALQLSRTWLQRRGYEGTDVLQDVLPGAELSAQRSVPLAPTFCPSDAMIQGLRDTEWPGRTQVLPHGPVTWYIDGAHTTSSIQACVRWFRQAALNEDKPQDGSEVRVLLFNATGDRDTAALLKLLLVRFWGAGGGMLSLGPTLLQVLGATWWSCCPSVLLSCCLPAQCRPPFRGAHSPSCSPNTPPSSHAGLGQPCHFDYAVFCPNFTEVSVAANSGEYRALGVALPPHPRTHPNPPSRPTKLQRDPGERPHALCGEPEDVDAADGGEGGPMAAGPPGGGGAAATGPPAGSPAPGAPGRAAAQLHLPRLPLHFPRAAVDHAGPGPPPAPACLQSGGSPAPCGHQWGCAAAGGGRHPCPCHRQPAPGWGGPQAAGPHAVPVVGMGALHLLGLEFLDDAWRRIGPSPSWAVPAPSHPSAFCLCQPRECLSP